jgi:hypothetical protein
MNLYVRALSCVALLGMSLAALSQYRPSWAGKMSLDWWNLSDLREQIHRGEDRDAELDRLCAVAAVRCADKAEATEELLAGRMMLAEAAARFRAVNAKRDAMTPPLEDVFPGATEEERVCRQVIAWAESASRIQGSAEAARQTRERLEAELNALLEKGHGVITLPE